MLAQLNGFFSDFWVDDKVHENKQIFVRSATSDSQGICDCTADEACCAYDKDFHGYSPKLKGFALPRFSRNAKP
ncbi:hypothetical protein [Roseovarius aestuarii]|uniref:Uncharacterized protein n=1 Tax=Roseovarius aestuarii TaxID=475083 RepID=A0A1X7BYI4_9RHOB|nr:hypothetical protein [Roseovarius aestuarii]SMC14671.1 hypothetical protein ROA7745_04540 [Roseovarius aestuarii]